MTTRDFCIRLGFKVTLITLLGATLSGASINYVYNTSLQGWAKEATNFAGIGLGGAILTIGIYSLYQRYLASMEPAPEVCNQDPPPSPLTEPSPKSAVLENKILIASPICETHHIQSNKTSFKNP